MTNFWKSKNILITGATGFIGSWLAETLIKKGARVTILIDKKSPFKEDAIKHLKKKLEIVYGDIRNKKLMEGLIKKYQIVFHLAAITQVLYSIKNPEETIAVNVEGTLNILEGIRKGNNKQFLVYVSTDKVYGEPKYLPIDENHSLSALSPYDASKVGADRLVYAYHKTYGIKATILRWANTYGGRDANLLRAVPDFTISVLKNKSPVIRGNGEHLRDFIYVTDVINAILLAGEKQNLSNGEAFNLGTKKPTSIKELAKLIIKISGNEKKLKLKILGKKTPGEIKKQFLAFKKAEKILGWKPTINLEIGLKMTLDWYKNNFWWEKVMERVNKFYGIKIN